MRAFVVTGPHRSEVRDVEDPAPAPGHVVIDIDRVGVCGTDVELFTGEMAYLQQGHAAYPIRLGHEWCGTVSAVGDGVDPGWVGRRTTGDTMLGCGRCDRCRAGRPHVCEDRYEVGIRRGFPGALAERMAMPVTALHPLPDAVDDVAGAMVEPGRRVVYIGVAGQPSAIDTRTLVLKDVTAVGILGASAGLAGTIEQYAAGAVDPRPLVAATVGLGETGDVLAGWRPPGAGPGPKIHVDPRG
jgi:threonine dehydrogenase-like Zn-dependent dehydrogenase